MINQTRTTGHERWDEEKLNKYAEAALEQHKREGMELAFRARWIGMGIIAVMLPFITPGWEFLYYEVLVLGFILIGWAQYRVASVGRSTAELALIYCDIMLMTFVVLVPNPLSDNEWPLAMEYRTFGFIYFFVLLASATLAYSWRTLRGIGTITASIWLLSLGVVWFLQDDNEALTSAAEAAYFPDANLASFLNPNSLQGYIRIQEIVVFIIVAMTLSITVRRYRDLLMGHVALERERTNLARYFSPNVVEELSQNDEPLKQVRIQNVSVLFVDIVGFTRFAANRTPQDVIETLREFHQCMEGEIFRHNGTLDKYLGDGLMATFGTPVAGDKDALNALQCARSMIGAIDGWNGQRAAGGESPLQVSFGLHYGPAVLGDIGSNRLEFAVIGSTVNIASRVEAMTRKLQVTLAATDDLIAAARSEARGDDLCTAGLIRREAQDIRGLDTKMTVWTLSA